MQEAYEYAEYGDVDLLRLISQGDKAAFDILYRRHWEFLYLSAFRVLKDRETCMDVLQEVFIWLWEHREDCRIVRVRPYLHAAVKYKITNYIWTPTASELARLKLKNLVFLGRHEQQHLSTASHKALKKVGLL